MKQKKKPTTEVVSLKPSQPSVKNARAPRSVVQATKNPPRRPAKTPPPVSEAPAPVYEIPESHENTKPASFSRLIPNDDILLALGKASYQVPSELLLNVLPATLRGSDTLIYKSQQSDEFLISVIPAISKLSHSEDSEKKRNYPTGLFLFPSEESLKSAFALTTDVFSNFKITFTCLEPGIKSDSNVIFATPNQVLEAQKNDNLNLSHVQLLCINALHMFEGADKDALNLCMASLADAKTQKIFTSYQNTPKVREFAFKYLEDPEIFSFLPVCITEQYPRQFAHALEATQKFQVLLGYLKTYKPRAALVVANTRTVAEWIAFKLHGNGIKVCLLTSPVSPYQRRNEFLNSVANGELHVFVTTDLALKNFGLEYVNCVYHFDLPDNPNAYLERLNKIDGSRNPISIAFVCEDYGFNMGKIEEKLGFKIRVTIPDKNFFNFKDISEYPLESSGRVKVIGQKSESDQKVSEQQSVLQKNVEPKTTEPNKLEAKTVEPQKIEPKTSRAEGQQHLPTKPRIDTKPTHQQPESSQQTHQQSLPTRHHQPDTSKFVRRDDRAREAVADALLAAKIAEEKRKAHEPQKSAFSPKSDVHGTSTTSKSENILSSVFFILSEALRAGAHATKESFSHNTERKFPALHKFLNRKKMK